MSGRLVGLALACATGLACSRPVAEQEAGIGERDAAKYVAVPLEVYLREGALVAGLDRSATRARLGAPDSVIARATQNRHDPYVTDSIVTLHYPDAFYVFYAVTQADRDLLNLAVISGDAHLRHASPGIGTSADSVRALLGEPLAARVDALEYDCLTCEVPLPVTFELHEGRVRAIRFEYYVD